MGRWGQWGGGQWGAMGGGGGGGQWGGAMGGNGGGQWGGGNGGQWGGGGNGGGGMGRVGGIWGCGCGAYPLQATDKRPHPPPLSGPTAPTPQSTTACASTPWTAPHPHVCVPRRGLAWGGQWWGGWRTTSPWGNGDRPGSRALEVLM